MWSDPSSAGRYFETLPRDSELDLSTIGEEWGKIEPERAVAWAGALSDSEDTSILWSVVGAWAGHDLHAAADYVVNLEDPLIQQQMASSVLSEYTASNPEAAAEWVDKELTHPAARANGFASLAVLWLQADRVAASQWIDSLPLGADRDAAIEGLLPVTGSADPDTSAAWAETLTDVARREHWLHRLRK